MVFLKAFFSPNEVGKMVNNRGVTKFRFLLDPDLDLESHPKELELKSCGSGSTLDSNPALDPDPLVDPNPSGMIIYLALFWDHYIIVGPISVILGKVS